MNNQDILDDVTQMIKGILDDTKAANLTSYEVINGYELDERNILNLIRSQRRILNRNGEYSKQSLTEVLR